MKIVPLWDRVLIERVEDIGGIIVPPSADARLLQRGKVFATGPGAVKVNPGEEVFFSFHERGVPVDTLKYEGKEYVVLQECQVLARLVEEKEPRKLWP